MNRMITCLECRSTFEEAPSPIWGGAFCPECRKKSYEKDRLRVQTGRGPSEKESLILLMERGPLSTSEITELRGKKKSSHNSQNHTMKWLLRLGFVRKTGLNWEIIEPITFIPIPSKDDNKPRCPNCASVLVFRKTVKGLVCKTTSCDLYHDGADRPYMKDGEWYRYSPFRPSTETPT